MAEAILPRNLPAASVVPGDAAIIIDTGSAIQKADPLKVVDAAAPIASQSDAETGSDNVNRMTALRVKQAIDALGVSAADLASHDPGKGAALVGTEGGGTVQSSLDAIDEVLFSDNYDMFIIYGQSNSVGWAASTPGFPADIHDRAQWFDARDGEIKKVVSALHSSGGQTSTGHGWAAFANQYIRETGRGVVIVSCGLGGLSITALNKGNDIYTDATDAVAAAKAEMTARGMPLGNVYAIWNQGESDAPTMTRSTYMGHLNTLIDDMKADMGVTRFFIQVLAYCQGYVTEIGINRIQQAQRDVSTSRADTYICSTVQERLTVGNGMMQGDNVHYTQAGYNLVGIESARQIAAILKVTTNDSFEGLRGQYGVISTTPRRRVRMASAQLRKDAGVWGIYKDGDTGTSYVAYQVDRVITEAASLFLVLVGSAPTQVGYSLQPNRTCDQFRITANARLTSAPGGSGEFGLRLEFLTSASFVLSGDGTITVMGGSATFLDMINSTVSVNVVGSVVTVTYVGGSCWSAPSVSPASVGGGYLSAASQSSFAVTFPSTADKVHVTLSNAIVLPEGLPQGAELTVVYFMGSQND